MYDNWSHGLPGRRGIWASNFLPTRFKIHSSNMKRLARLADKYMIEYLRHDINVPISRSDSTLVLYNQHDNQFFPTGFESLGIRSALRILRPRKLLSRYRSPRGSLKKIG